MNTDTQTIESKMGKIVFRKAKEKDVSTISSLTEYETLLPRSVDEVREILPYYFVAECVETGQIVGCISAFIHQSMLDESKYEAEIVSLRVLDEFKGNGIGSALLQLELEALKRRTDLKHIFAFTTEKVFTGSFSKAGFVEAKPQLFGAKVIQACAKCPKNVYKDGKHHCDEIAVLYPFL